jgi:hypothetical protein
MIRLGVWIIKDRETGSHTEEELSENIQELIESDPQNGRVVLNFALEGMVLETVKHYLENQNG